jgi:predicted MFS family arabinose efflux permease
LVAWLVQAGAAWSTLWLASAVLATLAGIGAAVLIPHDDRGAAAPAAVGHGAPPSADFVALLAAYGLFGFGYIITATFIVDMVRGSAALRALEPYVWVLVGLSAAPSVALWVSIARRFGILRSFALACLVEAVGVAASVLWLHPASIILAALFVGGTFMGLTALGLIAVRERTAGDPRRRIALMTAVFSVGQILGPALAGLAYDATGSFAMPSLVAVAALLLAALLAASAEVRRGPA